MTTPAGPEAIAAQLVAGLTDRIAEAFAPVEAFITETQSIAAAFASAITAARRERRSIFRAVRAALEERRRHRSHIPPERAAVLDSIAEGFTASRLTSAERIRRRTPSVSSPARPLLAFVTSPHAPPAGLSTQGIPPP